MSITAVGIALPNLDRALQGVTTSYTGCIFCRATLGNKDIWCYTILYIHLVLHHTLYTFGATPYFIYIWCYTILYIHLVLHHTLYTLCNCVEVIK